MPLQATDVAQAAISREESVKNHLPHILHIQGPNETAEKAILSAIRRLTAAQKYRGHGLECLSQVITSLSPASVRDNAFSWVELCTVKGTDDGLRELKLRVLGEIVKLSHKESDFNRRFVTNYLSKVFETCLTTVRVNPYECKAALTTLTVLMQTYPSWFGVYREKIEAFIVIFLDYNDKELVRAAAKAFHYLQQVGGAGTNGDNHKTNFARSLHKLCHTFRSLYARIVEDHSFEPNRDEIINFQLPDDFQLNSQRIENILEFVRTAMRTGFPVAKEVKPSLLLGILATALSFHKCLSKSDQHSLDEYRCSFVLLRLQQQALKCLKLMLAWLGTNLLPFSYQISRMIVESVERTSSCRCYKFDSLYRESAFAALTEWLGVCKSSLHPQFQARLLENFIEQIAPAKAPITLTISDNLTGKAKRRAMTERIIAGATETTERNEQLTAKQTLTAVKCLVRTTNLSVRASLLKRLYRAVFDTLRDWQSGRRFVAHPQGFYEILVGFYEQNVPLLPPLHAALTILSRGAGGNDRFAREACAEGLRVLEGLCQPVCPSLDLRAEPAEDFTGNEPNQEGQESDQDVTEYQVKYTESDRSTIEDALSESGALHRDLSVEEVSEEAPEAPAHGPPIVTAPSEDGNEILDDSEEPNREEEEAPSSSTDPNQIREESEAFAEEKRQDAAELDQPQIPEETHVLHEEEPNQNGVSEIKAVPEEDSLKDDDGSGEEVAGKEEGDCLEPAAKKLKLSEEESDGKDPDDSYLEDDSFVDVVKDYY